MSDLLAVHRTTSPASQTPTTVAVLRTLTSSPSGPLAALYRGLTPNLLGSATSWASFFFFKSRAERALAARHPPGAPLAPADYFIASGLAGAAVQVLTNPIWVLKTRMLSSDRGAHGAYPGMAAGARALLRAEGWRGFYRGLGVSLLGVSHGAVQFAVYEPAKRLYLARRAAGGSEGGSVSVGVSNQATLVISSLAKLVAGAVTYPYQVVRSRLQNYDAEERFGRGIVGVSRRLWAEEGLRGFYRGLVPGVIRVLPATWVTFLVYENVKFYLPRWWDV
jgi:solute carrier family 25 (mitochondrial folate transporter), member 32